MPFRARAKLRQGESQVGYLNGSFRNEFALHIFS